MRLTERDVQLLRDMALSHVLSRDQILALGYFTSVTRLNTRVRALIDLGLMRRIETPFFAQSLYAVTPLAGEVVGERIGKLIAGRSGSPRFLQHALCTTNVRLVLVDSTPCAWRFEQQVSRSFTHTGKRLEVRPDGMAVYADGVMAVEVDLGHVAPQKFLEKLQAYEAFIASGESLRLWGVPRFRVFTVTTGRLRASHLARLVAHDSLFEFECLSFEEFGVPFVGGWS